MKRVAAFFLHTVLSTAALLGGPATFAQQAGAPDVLLHPLRVVFDGTQRSAQLDLMNNLDVPATYRIRLVNRRMTETGELREAAAPDAGEQFADGMLRYSPRQVTLQPGTTQTVRVLLRRPAGLPAGEYRSHLLFERVPDTPAPSSNRGIPVSTGIAIQLQPLIGVSIPVIVRHGETRAQVAANALALEKRGSGAPSHLRFELRRTGSRSVFGDLEARFVGSTGKACVIGRAKGVAVYVPNAVRRARMALTPPPGVELTPGRIELVYRERPEQGGAVIAQAALQIP